MRFSRNLTVLIAGAALFLSACMIDNPTQPNLPSWSVDLEFPIIQKSVTINEIVSDSLFSLDQYGTDGDSIYSFHQSIEIPSIEVGQQLTIPDINQSVASTVGPISIADIAAVQTPTFDLQTIAPTLYSALDLAITMGGGTATVDSVPGADLDPVTSNISFDTFQSATFASGTIDITVHNGLFIPLGAPINVDLLDASSNTLASLTFADTIARNSQATQSFDLTGITLPQSVTVQVTGKTVGSSGEQMTLTSSDLSKGFYVEIGSTDLVASSATAQIPPQTISQSDLIPFDASGNVINYATIGSGYLNFDVENAMGLQSDLTLTIPSLVDDQNNPFSQVLTIPANQSVNQSISLIGYQLQLSSSQQEIGYSYDLQTEDPGSNFVTITQDDSVAVALSLAGLSFDELNGSIAPITIDLDPIQQDFSAMPEEMGGIEFKSVEMVIDFDTDIQIPILLNLDVRAENDAGEFETVQISNWDITDSSRVTIASAADLININPSSLIASGYCTIGGDGSILTTQSVAGLIDISAPLEFEITESATIEMDPTEIDQEFPENIEAITLYAQMDNQFEFGAAVDILAASSLSIFDTGTPDTLATIQIDAARSCLDSVALDSSKINLFQQDNLYIATQVSMLPNYDTDGNTTSTKFLSTDSLKISLYGTVRYLNDHLVSEEER